MQTPIHRNGDSDVADDLWMLVTKFRWPKPSPSSCNCHQHISSPTSVTNIDVTVLNQKALE